jgi:hypothetical protein
VPWYVNTFFKLISPFIDPVTKTKMKFNEPLTDHVPKEQLLTWRGGDVEFEYDHEIYWPELAQLCEERRAAMQKRWVARGSKIGESEFYLKGGEGETEPEKPEEKPEEKEQGVEEVTAKMEDTTVSEKKEGE